LTRSTPTERLARNETERHPPEEVAMRYMLLIHGNESGWDTLSNADRTAQYERYGALQREMEERGHHVAGDELASATSAKLVRVREGETTVSDGPLADTEEQFGGYFLVDCDLEAALAYAAKIPAAEGGTIEVRPLAEGI
jgi:hypothetical protein